jgi:hypothetical protein
MLRIPFLATLLVGATLLGHAKVQSDLFDWPTRARRDLNWLFATLSDNHPGFAVGDRDFIARAQAVHEQTLKLAGEVQDFNGYYLLLRRATNALGDGHMRVTPKNAGVLANLKLRWPGFWVAFPEGIRMSDGARVVSCDGEALSELIRKRVSPYFGRLDSSANEITWGARLFLDYQVQWIKPIRSCEFLTAGRLHTEPLVWREIDYASWAVRLPELQFGPRPSVGATQTNSGVYWVRLPTFLPARDEETEYRRILESREIGDAATIVYDLRGNTGGDSRWIDRFIEAALSVDETENYRMEIAKQKRMTVLYRASQANLDRVRAIATDPVTGKVDENFKLLSEQMAKALVTRTPVVVQSTARDPLARIEPVLATRKRIVVVTDGWCFSSCLVMLDRLKALRGLRHFGWPTDADTRYLQINQLDLPALPGIGDALTLTFPIAFFDRRYRSDNLAYEPDEHFPGRPTDQQGLEKWVLERL